MLLYEIHKAFSNIVFLDHYKGRSHVYLNTNTQKYIKSVTQTLGIYSPPFPPEMLEIKAQQLNVAPSELQTVWDLKRDFGTSKGSDTHNYLENRFNRKVLRQPLPHVWERLSTTLKAHYSSQLTACLNHAKAFVYHHPNLVPIKMELVVGDEVIAGQVDGLFWDSTTKEYLIIDYKTDKKIDFTTRYDKYFFDPISHLEYCEYNKYCLQISLYRYLLEKYTSIKLGTSKIVWLNANNESYRIIDLAYLKDEVHELYTLQSNKKSII